MALAPFYSLDRCYLYLMNFTRGSNHADLMNPLKFNRTENNLHKFLYDYYIPNWFGIDGQPARFSPNLWNHGRYEAENEHLDTPKTTNALESWHRTLNAIGHKQSKNFWTIFLAIRHELGEASVQKYNEVTSMTQNRRSMGPAQKRANALKAAMRSFDVNNIPKSLTDLARASHGVRTYGAGATTCARRT
jgi:hypothetical protein